MILMMILFSLTGEASKKTCVEEYDRTQKDLVPRLIPPTFTLGSYGQLPQLCDIPSMTRTARQAIVLHTLHVGENYIWELPENLSLLMSIMVFWVKNSRDGAVTKHHLSALLVSVSSSEIQTAGEQMKKYYSPLRGADTSILQGFAEWQTCFSAVRNLNELLLSPFSLPSPAQIYNGTFVNNVCVAFRTKPNFTQKILGHSTKLVAVFEFLQNHVLKHLPEGALASKKRKRVKNVHKAPKSSSSNFGSRFRGLSVEGKSSNEIDDK